jgi:hypothetical protein
MRLLKTGWEIGAEVLHLDKEEIGDDKLPTLEVTRMTDDDVQELRRVQEVEEKELLGLGIDPDNPDEVGDEIVDESELNHMIEEEPEPEATPEEKNDSGTSKD